MYIIFINEMPKEIHIDLDHAKNRKKFWEEYFIEESELNQEVKIGEVLEWENLHEEEQILGDVQYNIPEIDNIAKEISNDIDNWIFKNMSKMHHEIESIFVRRGITKDDKTEVTYQSPNLYSYSCNGIPVCSVGIGTNGAYQILEHFEEKD